MPVAPSASDQFAATAKQLNDLAAKVLDARARGDYTAALTFKAQWDTLYRTVAPDQKRAAAIAHQDDQPSQLELWLLGAQQWLSRAPAIALGVLVLGVVVFAWARGRK